MSGARIAWTLAAALVVCATARAESDREARARAHYEVGLGMYHLGNYADAVREFSAGYELSPRPEFLINLGQAYRKLHDLDRARDMFERYMARAPADAPDRVQVRSLLAEVEAERAAVPPTPGAPPPSAPPPRAPPTTNAPSATNAPSPALVVTPPALLAREPPPRRGLRRWWWTIPVGAVAVGAALGVTLYLTLRSSQVSCGSATIACVDLRP
ncbi:MAG TPA: tetratricopeptide repeat protein [Polyangia bacterium]|nr:tetratricopeptide repeat protein [Polyangia bacterium]